MTVLIPMSTHLLRPDENRTAGALTTAAERPRASAGPGAHLTLGGTH